VECLDRDEPFPTAPLASHMNFACVLPFDRRCGLRRRGGWRREMLMRSPLGSIPPTQNASCPRVGIPARRAQHGEIGSVGAFTSGNPNFRLRNLVDTSSRPRLAHMTRSSAGSTRRNSSRSVRSHAKTSERSFPSLSTSGVLGSRPGCSPAASVSSMSCCSSSHSSAIMLRFKLNARLNARYCAWSMTDPQFAVNTRVSGASPRIRTENLRIKSP
jgi:hypothetical protein